MKTSLLILALFVAALTPAGAVKPKAKPADAPDASTATTPTPAPAKETPGGPKLAYTLFHINNNAIALTFDDGPHVKNTPRLLQILKERDIKATYFLIGKNVANYPEYARQISDAGHEIGNHTWSHAMMRKLSDEKIIEELQKTHDAIVAACGVTPVLWRPPFGAITKKQEQMIMDHFHYTTILWEVDTRDWQAPRTVAKVHDTMLKDTHAGSIILCHEIHETTIDAMAATLDELKAKGFQFLTISQMIKLEADTFKAPPGSPVTAPGAATPPAKGNALPVPPTPTPATKPAAAVTPAPPAGVGTGKTPAH